MADERDGKVLELAIDGPRFSVTPGAPVTLGADVRVEDQALRLDLAGGASSIWWQKDRPCPAIEVLARGQFRGEDVEVGGEVDPLSALPVGRDMRVDLSATGAELYAGIRGSLASLRDLRGSRFAVTVFGEGLSVISPFVGVDIPVGQPFALTADLRAGDRGLDFNDLAATIGGTDLSSDLRLRLVGRPSFSATVHSRCIDLTPVSVLRTTSIAAAAESG